MGDKIAGTILVCACYAALVGFVGGLVSCVCGLVGLEVKFAERLWRVSAGLMAFSLIMVVVLITLPDHPIQS